MPMISYETRCLVLEQLKCELFICEPSDILMCQTPEGKCYAAPEDVTEDDVLDLLRRSAAAGRNLFTEEWPEYHFDRSIIR